jgi:Fe-S cluster assembly ATP-binding protein
MTVLLSFWKQAKMAILDEIDSGLDIDALRDVAKAVNALKRPDSSVLMVTHYKVS